MNEDFIQQSIIDLLEENDEMEFDQYERGFRDGFQEAKKQLVEEFLRVTDNVIYP